MGETHRVEDAVSLPESIGEGGEPGEVKHLSTRRKRNQKIQSYLPCALWSVAKMALEIPSVAASERGRA